MYPDSFHNQRFHELAVTVNEPHRPLLGQETPNVTNVFIEKQLINLTGCFQFEPMARFIYAGGNIKTTRSNYNCEETAKRFFMNIKVV